MDQGSRARVAWVVGLVASTSGCELFLGLHELAQPQGGGLAPTTTYGKVYDPSRVAVEVDGPDGGRTVLPGGASIAEAEIPRTSPPYEPDVLYTASALRRGGGGITLRCDACPQAPLQVVLPDDGDLPEIDPESLHFDGDAVRIRLAYSYWPRLRGPKTTAFRATLAIPPDNVEIRRKRPVSEPESIVFPVFRLAVGLGLIGAGSYCFYASQQPATKAPGVVFALGVPLALYGVSFSVMGTTQMFDRAAPIPGFDERVWPK